MSIVALTKIGLYSSNKDINAHNRELFDKSSIPEPQSNKTKNDKNTGQKQIKDDHSDPGI
jgi:hypothetical protein